MGYNYSKRHVPLFLTFLLLRIYYLKIVAQIYTHTHTHRKVTVVLHIVGIKQLQNHSVA